MAKDFNIKEKLKLNLTKPLVIFDLEATGLDLVNDRIIQIAYIKVNPDGTEIRRNYLVNPGIPIPPEVVTITSIRNEDVHLFPDRHIKIADIYPAMQPI